MIFGIVLAAGLGRRIGTPKALLVLDGETFHRRALRSLKEAELDVVTVVNPGVDAALPLAIPGEHRIVNPDPDQGPGMFASAKLGVLKAMTLGAEGVLFLPVDHPLVTAEDLRALVRHLSKGAAIVVATHGGRRGHPVGINREIMAELATDPETDTLRDLVRRDPGRVVEVEISPGAILGINTGEDLERVSNRSFR